MPRSTIAGPITLKDSSVFSANFTQTNTNSGGDILIDANGAYGQYTAQAGAGDDYAHRASARYTGTGTVTADQASSAVLAVGLVGTAARSAGVCVLASGSNTTRTHYEVSVSMSFGSTFGTTLRKVVNNTVTILYADTVSWAVGQRVELEADTTTTPGSTILRVCKDGVPLGGGFTLTDSTSPISTGNPGIVASGNEVHLTDWIGSNLTAGTAPSITTQPTNQSVTAGATATFTAAASGTPTPTYQWQRSTNSGSTWTDISGAVSASYTTPATTVTGGTANNGDQYRVVASNGVSPAANSTAATLTVNAPTDTTNPTLSGTISIGSLVSTSYTATCPVATDNVAVTGYQYRINAGSWTTIAAGGRVATITGRTAGTTDALDFRAFDAAGLYSPVLSTSVTLPAAGGTFSMSLGPFTLNTNTGALLSTPVSYTLWPGVDTGAISGTPINGTGTTHATTGVLSISGLTAAGSYLVCLKNSDGSGRWNNVATAA